MSDPAFAQPTQALSQISIRHRILNQLKYNIEQMAVGEPSDDPYQVTWASVGHTPITDRERGKWAAVAILDTDERKEAAVGWMDCFLRVAVEFSSVVPTGWEPDVFANMLLTNLQRKIREDIYLKETAPGGENKNLALNVEEAGNNLDVDSFLSKRIDGVIFLNLRYRHAEDDPRQPYPKR